MDFNTVWSSNLALKYLNFSDNENEWSLSRNAFQKMVNLQQLNMSRCCKFIPENPDFFRDLNNLEVLDISKNIWRKPPKTAFFPLRKLKHLEMSNTNAVVDTSIFFAALPNLESISLGYISEELLNMSNFRFSSSKLQKVSLRGNNLTGFGQTANFLGMPNSSALRYLDLSDVNVDSLQVNFIAFLRWRKV